jgi:hypothetical protein
MTDADRDLLRGRNARCSALIAISFTHGNTRVRPRAGATWDHYPLGALRTDGTRIPHRSTVPIEPPPPPPPGGKRTLARTQAS